MGDSNLILVAYPDFIRGYNTEINKWLTWQNILRIPWTQFGTFLKIL